MSFRLPYHPYFPAPGRPVVMGLRPEHLRVSTDNIALTATVVVIEPSGAETLLILLIGPDDRAHDRICAIGPVSRAAFREITAIPASVNRWRDYPHA